MMVTIKRTNSDDKDFQELVKHLDAYLKILDGAEHSFYNQLNKIDTIKHAVVAYNQNNQPVGCGAIREYMPGTMEVKRMYVPESSRGQGIASIVLKELENWSREMAYKKCVLETGKRQPEAIALYTKNGYQLIGNYGKYANMENSVCYEKLLLK